MTGQAAAVLGSRRRSGREQARREVLDAAWALMARDGVAALSVRELAAHLGVRPQSLAYYFPTKAALLDALFADGFTSLRERLLDTGEGLDAAVEALLAHCTESPARCHLLLQRTVPGFSPSRASQAAAVAALSVLSQRLAAAGLTDPRDLDAVRCLVSGIAAEQVAHDPGGRRFVAQAPRAVRALVAGLRGAPPPEGGAPA